MLNLVKKTIAYVKRNGIRAAYYAAKERMEDQKISYTYTPVPENELEEERRQAAQWKNECAVNGTEEKNGRIPRFSILVPCYQTPELYFKAMTESVIRQTYPEWELILADASGDDTLADFVRRHYSNETRIRYQKLSSNDGISANTNAALSFATGDYCCLLDHDDVITPDALFKVAETIHCAMKKMDCKDPSKCHLQLIYSDEDKCDGEETRYYEPNRKPDFNLDYLLSNNYICHFTSIRTDILKQIRFRPAYDGAQDLDVILRTALPLALHKEEQNICHIPEVLYHWRCHEASTAANPESKRYAYDAGKRAVEDNLKCNGMNCKVTDLPHVGFYRAEYPDGIFRTRTDIGIIGGKILDVHGKIAGGIYTEDGTLLYAGLPRGYSGGFQHKAACQQEADAVDLRCMRIRRNLRPLLKEVTGLEYMTREELLKHKDAGMSSEDTALECIHGHRITIPGEWDEAKIRKESIRFCKAVRKRGYHVLWDPKMSFLKKR